MRLDAIEFKFEKPARKAMRQFEGKEYDVPFAMNGQKFIRIGMTFSRWTRNIAKVVIRKLFKTICTIN